MSDLGWRSGPSREIANARVFRVEAAEWTRNADQKQATFYSLKMPDWVVVVPQGPDGKFRLVRQFRFGVAAETLEFPAGVVDPGESPEATARRELREETGLEADCVTPLGWEYPNPALQDNRCHYFRAEGAATEGGGVEFDPHEKIEVVALSATEVSEAIHTGAINHALAIAAWNRTLRTG